VKYPRFGSTAGTAPAAPPLYSPQRSALKQKQNQRLLRMPRLSASRKATKSKEDVETLYLEISATIKNTDSRSNINGKSCQLVALPESFLPLPTRVHHIN